MLWEGEIDSGAASYVVVHIEDLCWHEGSRFIFHGVLEGPYQTFSYKKFYEVRRKGKLSPLYIYLFDILVRAGEVAYMLALLPNLSGIKPVFHVSML